MYLQIWLQEVWHFGDANNVTLSSHIM